MTDNADTGLAERGRRRRTLSFFRSGEDLRIVMTTVVMVITVVALRWNIGCPVKAGQGNGPAIEGGPVIFTLTQRPSGQEEIMGTMEELFAALLEDESGQDLAEYGLLLALITVAVVTLITTLGGQIENAFQSTVDALTTAGM